MSRAQLFFFKAYNFSVFTFHVFILDLDRMVCLLLLRSHSGSMRLEKGGVCNLLTLNVTNMGQDCVKTNENRSTWYGFGFFSVVFFALSFRVYNNVCYYTPEIRVYSNKRYYTPGFRVYNDKRYYTPEFRVYNNASLHLFITKQKHSSVSQYKNNASSLVTCVCKYTRAKYSVYV